jgi:hypothetical protein
MKYKWVQFVGVACCSSRRVLRKCQKKNIRKIKFHRVRAISRRHSHKTVQLNKADLSAKYSFIYFNCYTTILQLYFFFLFFSSVSDLVYFEEKISCNTKKKDFESYGLILCFIMRAKPFVFFFQLNTFEV